MRQIPIIFLLCAACIPISSDVSTYGPMLETWRHHTCDTRGVSDECPVELGHCWEAARSPIRFNQYDSNSSCYVDCMGPERECPRDHSCVSVVTNQGESSRDLCMPQMLCHSDGDCVNPRFGGQLGLSRCDTDDFIPTCRYTDQVHCDDDEVCTQEHGDEALCIAGRCQRSCGPQDGSVFAGRCVLNTGAGNDHGEEHARAWLTRFEWTARLDDQDQGANCEGSVGAPCTLLGEVPGICEDLGHIAGHNRTACLPIMNDRDQGNRCPAGWRHFRRDRDTGGQSVADVCVPYLPCYPSFDHYSTGHGTQGRCPFVGAENDQRLACRSELGVTVVHQNQNCLEGEPSCPGGSSCYLGVCLLDGSDHDADLSTDNIPGCRLATERQD